MMADTFFYYTRGLPGSGKTTWARKWVEQEPEKRARINRDDLRAMMHNGIFIGEDTEQQVRLVRNRAIGSLLGYGYSVVNDDTNLTPKDVKSFEGISRRARSGLVAVDFRAVPLDVCLKRNKERTDKPPIPEDVIISYYEQFIRWREETFGNLPVEATEERNSPEAGESKHLEVTTAYDPLRPKPSWDRWHEGNRREY